MRAARSSTARPARPRRRLSPLQTGVSIGGTAGAVGLVFNYGTIENTTTNGSAVSLASGGTAINHGLIESGRTGISFNNTAGTIDNFGAIISTATLSGTRGAGAYLGAGGLVTNETGASISAVRAAVSLAFFGTTSAAATVVNSGTLTGDTGISIGPGDTGSNTIVNFGTIIGTSGTAIRLGAGNDLVIIEAGSSLQGVISGNFHPGDRFDLPFLTFSNTGTVTLDPSTHALQIVENAGTYTINLDPGQSFAGDAFQLAPDTGAGTLVTETAPAAINWTNSSGGDWTLAGNWSGGVPASSIDATLGVLANSYTVTLTATGVANSLTLGQYYTALNLYTPNGGTPASLAIQGNLNNAGSLYVDGYYGNTGGSTLTIVGTLTNSYDITIGTSSLSASTMATAAALANTGTIDLTGGTGTNTNQATLDISSGAPSVLAGHLDLTGRALVEFAGGSIGGIATNSALYLRSASAFIADSGNIGSNSALSGLTSNAGTLELDNGAALHTLGDFSNSNVVLVDYSYSTIDGSSLTIDGTLRNTGTLRIGYNNQAGGASTVSASGLTMTATSYIYLTGGTGTYTNQATLDISGMAPSVLNGRLELTGHALAEFGGGGITSIGGYPASLYLHGANAFVADAFDTTSNSALSGLTSNAGTLELDNGATIGPRSTSPTAVPSTSITPTRLSAAAA